MARILTSLKRVEISNSAGGTWVPFVIDFLLGSVVPELNFRKKYLKNFRRQSKFESTAQQKPFDAVKTLSTSNDPTYLGVKFSVGVEKAGGSASSEGLGGESRGGSHKSKCSNVFHLSKTRNGVRGKEGK
jgi:hypothetical protein